MDKMTCFLLGLALGLFVAIFALDAQSNDNINACNEQGYYEQSGKIIRCSVIDKSELIKRVL